MDGLPNPEHGTLRLFLGAAPGVGKTFAMLNEGWRAKHRGTDVVVGFVETHGRKPTEAQIRDLEVVPRRRIAYRDAEFTEMDVDAVLARAPELALVDELAHTNVPGSRNEKRWQDVEELLDAGIDVVSTLNIQHLESLNDVIAQITGVVQRETIPDEVVRRADDVQLVDMTPEALRRRLARGDVYAPEKIDAALANYFRPGNLGALRELGLLWVADNVDEALRGYQDEQGITGVWETRERVVVAVGAGPRQEHLIRRGARMAMRSRGDLVVVHVRTSDGLRERRSGELDAYRKLTEELGGQWFETVGPDVGDAMLEFARSQRCTQLVLGATARSRLAELVGGSVVTRVIRGSGPIDVHVISAPEPGKRSVGLPRVSWSQTGLPTLRVVQAWVGGAVGLPALALLFANTRSHFHLPSVLLGYLLLVVVVGAVGGAWPALATAVAASLVANWFFTPPYHTFIIGDVENALALGVFVGVAVVVSALVVLSARRSVAAARARAEADAITRAASTAALREDPIPALLEHIRATFRLETAALYVHDDGWQEEARAGPPLPERREQVARVPISDDVRLSLVGRTLTTGDLEVLRGLAGQLLLARRSGVLRLQADSAERLAATDSLRTALLAAVSHDLRTPLASIKASVTSLLQADVDWTPEARQEFLHTIDEETDRLNALVGNLLDMSRIQTGILSLSMRPVGLEEVVPSALSGLPRESPIVVNVAETLPRIHADPALLERAIANVVDNALAWSSPERPARVTAGEVSGRVVLRVIDRGPGIPDRDRRRVFEPFQRVGDGTKPSGVGLGLSVARGFVAAMGGELTLEDTPGGGLTVAISFKVSGE